MPTNILPNKEVGKRAERTADVVKLSDMLTDLKNANRDWDLLTALQTKATQKLMLRAIIAVIAYLIDEIKDRSKRA
jgi:hypothetical protein